MPKRSIKLARDSHLVCILSRDDILIHAAIIIVVVNIYTRLRIQHSSDPNVRDQVVIARVVRYSIVSQRARLITHMEGQLPRKLRLIGRRHPMIEAGEMLTGPSKLVGAEARKAFDGHDGSYRLMVSGRQ